MDLMEIRRRLMMGMQTAWKYERHVFSVDENLSYDEYTDFESVYVTPFVGDATTYAVIVNIYNNTSNTRAGIYHMEYVSQQTKLVNIGERVGGNFLNNYGADFYPGSTIEVFVSKDVPIITT